MVKRACNPSYSGGWGRRIAWTREAEVAVSRDHATALQPRRQGWDFVSKKKKKRLRIASSLERKQGLHHGEPWMPGSRVWASFCGSAELWKSLKNSGRVRCGWIEGTLEGGQRESAGFQGHPCFVWQLHGGGSGQVSSRPRMASEPGGHSQK